MTIKDEIPKEGSLVRWQEDGCFVCGKSNPYGLKLIFDVDRENLVSKSRVIFRPEHQGWDTVVHGGILAAVMDDAMAYAIMASGKLAITTRMALAFRKPVKVGEELLLEGRVESMKSRLATTSAIGYTMEDGERVIKVEAEGAFYLDRPMKGESI